MLYGEETVPISNFLHRVMLHTEGADNDMVLSYVMDSIIEFVRDAQILTEIVCIDLIPCQDSYKIHTNRRVVEVLSIRIFVDGTLVDSSKFDFRVESNTLYTNNIEPHSDYKVELEFSVAPYRDSEEVPAFLYEDWVTAITALTLTKLYLLTDTDWYNASAANNQMVVYKQELRKARFRRITKHKPFKMRLANKRRL